MLRLTAKALWVSGASVAVLTAGVVVTVTGLASGDRAASGSGSGTVTAVSDDESELQVQSLGVPAPGLLPGVGSVLSVSVRNGSPQDGADATLTLTDLTVEAADAAPGCSADDLHVQPYRSAASGAQRYVLAAGQAVLVELPILLRDTGRDQTACLGQQFPLVVHATAEAG